MQAIIVNADRSLVWSETPAPSLNPGMVRIAVSATAVNRADLLQRAGHYPPPPGASDILGLECAGTISAVADDVARWKVGDRVCALLAGGGYAESVVCPEGHLFAVPSGMSDEQAAALPEVLTTAWLNIFIEAGALAGERVLIHAGASGVGTAAIQLCVERRLPCWVTVGSNNKLERCLALGASGGWVRSESGFATEARIWTGGHGFDVILDPVGAAYLDDNLTALGSDGRLLLIGILGGRKAQIDLGRLLVKRQRVIGSTLRSRSDNQKAALIDRMNKEIWPAVIAGRIEPVIHTVMPITTADDAHRLLRSNTNIGKIVLSIGH